LENEKVLIEREDDVELFQARLGDEKNESLDARQD
jgi:hypothetical protein